MGQLKLSKEGSYFKVKMTTFVVTVVLLSVLLKTLLSNPLEGGPQPTGCCDWPSCYDERTELCLDTCLMTWSQCPSKLTLMSCYSEYMSPFGALPLQCFPDSEPHVEEAGARGFTGSTAEVREKLHQLLNVKTCHGTTGICRPREF